MYGYGGKDCTDYLLAGIDAYMGATLVAVAVGCAGEIRVNGCTDVTTRECRDGA